MDIPQERQCRSKILHYLSYVTVEPTLILYMMAFMVTTIIEQAFFVDKACRVNHKLNDTICSDISNKNYVNITKEVQITVSNFHLYNDIAGHSIQIILALFMGAWSDKRGRKWPLLLGLIGKFYYSLMIVVNSLQPTWPLEYVVTTATLPMAFTGADVAIFAAAYTYLIDVSSQENRTLRVSILEVFYLATVPSGIALGSFLFNNVLNKSYTYMFTINTSLMAISILYTLFRLKWLTNDRQRPLSEAKNLFLDFFDYRYILETSKALYKERPHNKRRYLLILIVLMSLYTFQRDEKNMMYLYVQVIFNWDVPTFSTFKAYQSALQDILLFCAIPLMSIVWGWRDTVIIMIGALAHSVARIFYATADSGTLFYIGGAFAALGPIVAPCIRSMVSKIVSNSEKGKIFSMLSVADNAVPLVSGVCYSQLYNYTIHDRPNSIFYLTFGTQLLVFLCITYVHFTTNEDKLEKGNSEEGSELNNQNNAEEELS